MKRKVIHAVALIIILLASAALYFRFPILFENVENTFSTLGTLVTFYAVTIAVIEMIITRREAERVFSALTNIYTAKEIKECQLTINYLLAAIEEERSIPITSLNNIVMLYSRVFSSEMKNEASIYRANRSSLTSYSVFAKNRQKKVGSSAKLQETLILITAHLAELEGLTKNFTEFEQ